MGLHYLYSIHKTVLGGLEDCLSSILFSPLMNGLFV